VRNIQDILYFRGDVSPFLVHLTRRGRERSAGGVLEAIIRDSALRAGQDPISDARFGMSTLRLSGDQIRRYFGAISLTETPLSEVHSLLEIRRRKVNLEPYGLVFLLERLRRKGVRPVWYLNNENQDQNGVVQALCRQLLREPDVAEQLLPLIAVFGYQLTAPGAARRETRVDFTWEREWRWPAAAGELEFGEEDVFVGLCPHEEIAYFEDLLPGVRFIDPRRPMKWYATQLIEARHRHDLKYSVV
jgi:hypothetical protein